MAENLQRSRGRPQGYKFDRGNTPTEMGPYIGIVVNNVDNTRSGRLQVYIEEFGAIDKSGKPNLKDPHCGVLSVTVHHSMGLLHRVVPVLALEPIRAIATAMACGLLHQT